MVLKYIQVYIITAIFSDRFGSLEHNICLHYSVGSNMVIGVLSSV